LWVRPLGGRPAFVESVDALASRVADGAVVSPGGFHFSRVPVRLLEAIARRRPRNLTYVQWGGGLALEILLEAGCVSRLVFCFSNLDIFGMAPHFRRALEAGTVEAVEITALELHQALLARVMNLPSLPLQTPLGSWRATDRRTSDGLSDAPDVPLDVVLLHAQRADTAGNLELAGSQGLDRTLAFAGRRVLATVEQVVTPGTFTAKAAVIPRQFVEAIAVVPGGAWPTSCLPLYGPDYREIARRVSEGRFATDETRPPLVAREAYLAATEGWAERPWPAPRRHAAVGAAEMMIAWLSRRLTNESVCSVGAVSPLATVAYLMAKHTHAPDLTLVTYNGGYVDAQVRFMSLTMAEAADFQSAALHCGGDDSYRWFYQQGRVTHEVVGAAQIDREGRTNNRWVKRADGSRVRLPGQGGMADVANMHRNFTLYATRQSRQQLIEHVAESSAARALVTTTERAAHGYGPGDVALVTNLGAFVLAADDRTFHLTSVHDGVAVEDVIAATGFALTTNDAVGDPPPTPEELAAIDQVDPFGIRRLEFVPARERLPLLMEVLDLEQAYLRSGG
jgi:glutaconate CoA-transferase subunit A